MEHRGSLRVRPLRIAFLVQENLRGQETLDGIFADAYARWGGRFSLIVPCVEGAIKPAYWPWLEKYDPDIVYSYAQLEERYVLEIHRRLYPGEYIEHDPRHTERGDVVGFKPRWRFDPLSSLSAAFTAARYFSKSLVFIDHWYGTAQSRFFADNFDSYSLSAGNGIIPPDAKNALQLLTIVPPEILADRRYGVSSDLNTIPDEATALSLLSEGKAHFFSTLSASFVSRSEFNSHAWNSGFRKLGWNACLGAHFSM